MDAGHQQGSPVTHAYVEEGKYYSHPHDLGTILLQEWGDLWTLDRGSNLATQMWARLKILIANSRGKDMLDTITPDDVTQGIKS